MTSLLIRFDDDDGCEKKQEVVHYETLKREEVIEEN